MPWLLWGPGRPLCSWLGGNQRPLSPYSTCIPPRRRLLHTERVSLRPLDPQAPAGLQPVPTSVREGVDITGLVRSSLGYLRPPPRALLTDDIQTSTSPSPATPNPQDSTCSIQLLLPSTPPPTPSLENYVLAGALLTGSSSVLLPGDCMADKGKLRSKGRELGDPESPTQQTF